MSDRIKKLRAEIKAELAKPLSREAMERRVYIMPVSLLERVLRFQLDNRLKSEAEAVRQLIDQACRRWEGCE